MNKVEERIYSKRMEEFYEGKYMTLSEEADKKVDELCKKAIAAKWPGVRLYKELRILSKTYLNVLDTEVAEAIYAETGINIYD